MDSITQNNENEHRNLKRYLPHDINTKYHAVLMYLNNSDVEYTCRKYHISRYVRFTPKQEAQNGFLTYNC